MFHGYYIVWGLLPFLFLVLTLWATWKRVFKMQGREFGADYLSQTVFCAGGLALSIGIDQLISDDLLLMLTYEIVNEDNQWVPRILLYPAVLLLMSYAQKVIRKEKKERVWTHKKFLN